MASQTENGDGSTYTVRQLRFRDFRFDLHLVPLTLHVIEFTLTLSGTRGSRTAIVHNSLDQVVVSVSPHGFSLEVSRVKSDY